MLMKGDTQSLYTNKTNSVALSPQANYTDWALPRVDEI
jgi:hypothetical protein